LSALDPAVLAGQVVEAAPDGIIFADSKGIIHLWNPGAERIFGYSASEAVGQSLDLIIPERLRQRHWDAYFASMASGTTRYGASELLAVPAMHKDGSRLSIEFTIALLRDEAGVLMGPAAIIRDVSVRFREQAELRRRLAELEAATSSVTAV
jgi:PAS domain S-box-containing protein